MIDLQTETEINGVRVRLTKKQRTYPARERLRLSRLVRALGHVAAATRQRWLSRRIKRRLDYRQGATVRGRFVVSKRYARSMGLDRNWFRDRAEFEAQKPRARVPYWNTGGMWGAAPPDHYGSRGGGMQVRGVGAAGATIDFYGQSVGAASKEIGVYKRGKKAGQRRFSGKVPNWRKAGTVWAKTGNNLTQPDDDDLEDFIRYVLSSMQDEIQAQLIDTGKSTRVVYVNSALGRKLERLKR